MRRPPERPAAGVALIAVLWMVAAMSVLVTGIVQTQKAELRQAGAARARLIAGATGQAAIQLVLQRLTGGGPKPDRLTRTTVRHAGLDIEVEVMPLTGLVDLNTAEEPLLVALLVQAGGIDEPRARSIAAAVIDRRKPRAEAPALPPRLEAPEELLSLPGVDVDLFATLHALMTTESAGNGRVNALAAPESVLSVLARGNADLARRIALARDSGAAGIDTTQLEAAFIDGTVSSRYRFTATVPMADGSRVAVVRDVETAPAADVAAPWQTLRSSSRRLGASVSGPHGDGG